MAFTNLIEKGQSRHGAVVWSTVQLIAFSQLSVKHSLNCALFKDEIQRKRRLARTDNIVLHCAGSR